MNSTPADEHKFLELVNENRNRILRVCRVYSWNSADQDDLYQEILFQIWRGLPALKEKQFANTWLYRVAINTAISFVRKRASRSDRVIHFEHADLTRTIESRQAPDPSKSSSCFFTRSKHSGHMPCVNEAWERSIMYISISRQRPVSSLIFLQ